MKNEVCYVCNLPLVGQCYQLSVDSGPDAGKTVYAHKRCLDAEAELVKHE